MQANSRLRRRSNLGKRRQSAWPEFKPDQSMSGLNVPPRSALSRHHLSAKKTPVGEFNIAAYETQLLTDSNQLLTKKRLFELRSPLEMTLVDYAYTPNQDVTGIFCLNPSPEPSASSCSPFHKTLNVTLFDRLEPPKSPVLKFSFTSNHPSVADLKPPVDPEDGDDWKVSSDRCELALKDCTSRLDILEISDGETKQISPTDKMCVARKEFFDDSSPLSNRQHSVKPEVFRFGGEKLVDIVQSEPGEPSVVVVRSEPGKTESDPPALKESIYKLQGNESNHKRQNEKRDGIKPSVGSKEVSQEANSPNDFSFNQFKKPESILQVLRSCEKKLSVVNEDDFEPTENSLEDSFLLAEETISDLTIVGDPKLDDTVLKCEEKILQNSTDFCSANLQDTVVKCVNDLGDSDDDINDLLTHIDRISEGGKEQQILYEKELARLSEESKKQQILYEKKLTSFLEESRKRQIIREKELSQLRQWAYRFKKKNKSKHQPSVENKENEGAKSTVKNEWIREMKKDNPNLLKTPKVQRTNGFSVADQSTIWTPHSLSKMISNQVDDLYD